MARRAPETLADYVVVGIAPALIMLLVGSLVFFLIGVFYQGDFPYRLTWVMGLFVLATVCVARISMEEGAAYAALYGLPLGVVVGIAVLYFVEIRGPLALFSPLINLSLLMLIWWCAHQLTWDCTLLDNRRDTTGQGLLQSMGWDRSANTNSRQETAAASSDDASTTASAEKPLWWQRWFREREQPAAHGRWVVYFSVAALPLFGLGQIFIPPEDVAGRRYAFWMLVIYVASALGLLLTTSFLGLRRYIRQRQLEMPVEMAATWLSVGVLMIVGLLTVAALLPRPAPEYSLADAIEKRLGRFVSPDRSASRGGFGAEGARQQPETPSQGSDSDKSADDATGSKPGEPSEGDSSAARGEQGQQKGSTSSYDGKSGQQSSSGEQASSGRQAASDQQASSDQGNSGEGQASDRSQESDAKNDGGSGSSSDKSSNDPGSTAKTANTADGQSGKPDGNNDAAGSESDRGSSTASSAATSSTAPSQPPAPRPPLLGQAISSIGNLLRILFYAALAVIAAVLAWKYREQLAAAWRQLLKELGDLWARWFGQAVTRAQNEPAAAPPPRPKSFRDFRDPFATGDAHRMTPAQLVQYSFEALEAWGRDFAAPRENGQTPHEFSEALAAEQPMLDAPARQLAEIYSRMAYARQPPPQQTVAILQSLWRTMESVANQPISAGSSGRPVGNA